MPDPKNNLGRGLDDLLGEARNSQVVFTHAAERLLHVPLAQLFPGPNAPAPRTPDPAFVNSIKTYGVLHPLLVRKVDEHYEVLAGFQRLEAARIANLPEVPVRVYRVEDAALDAFHAASNLSATARRKIPAPLPASTAPRRDGGLAGLFEEELNSPPRRPPYQRILVIAGILLLAGWLYLIVANRVGDRNKRPESDPVPQPTADAVPTPSATASLRPTPPPSARNPALLAQLERIRGVKVRDLNGVLRITFDEPVFSSVTTIADDQKQRLLTIATAVRRDCPSCMIAVIGHTDNDPVRAGGAFADNKALGLKRAQEVRDHLVRLGGVPATHLTLHSMGAENPPFPNTPLESKKKNRTVTLEVITPR